MQTNKDVEKVLYHGNTGPITSTQIQFTKINNPVSQRRMQHFQAMIYQVLDITHMQMEKQAYNVLEIM